MELEDEGNTTNTNEDQMIPSVSQSELRRMAKFRDRLTTRLWEKTQFSVYILV